jgi:hypothetical protein
VLIKPPHKNPISNKNHNCNVRLNGVIFFFQICRRDWNAGRAIFRATLIRMRHWGRRRREGPVHARHIAAVEVAAFRATVAIDRLLSTASAARRGRGDG